MSVTQNLCLVFVRNLVFLLAALAWPTAVVAQPPVVRVSATATPTVVAPGGRAVVTLTIEIDEGWHIYPNAEKPDAILNLDSVPTEVAFQKGSPVRVGTITWPKATVKSVTLGKVTGRLPFLEGKVVVQIPITLSADVKPGLLSLKLTTSYQPCDDMICLRPADDDSVVDLTVDVAAPAFDFKTIAGFDPSTFDGAPPTAISPSASDATSDRLDVGLGLTISTSGTMGLLAVLGIGLVGGFVLNLTPCVLPVIPIKIIGLQQAAAHAGGGRGRTLLLGFLTAFGVVLFWVTMGVLIVVFKAIPGVATLFTDAYFQLGIAVFVSVMGLGLLGAFEIKLPQALYAVNPRHDTVHGSILFGLMTAVLGTPCFGPFAGAVLGWATQQPSNFVPLATFVSIGVGMALPYVVLAAWPGLIAFIPRTGPASELVKQVMGLLLLAASAFFYGVSFLILQADHPGLKGNLHWCLVAAMCVVAGGWIVIRAFGITRSLPRRAVFTVVGLAIASASVWWAYRQVNKVNLWTTWTAEVEARAKADGKVIVTDYTAIWCINCKFLEVLFEDSDVEIALRDPRNAALQVDLTPKDAPGWAKMSEIHEVGIPVATFEGPGTSYDPARIIKLRFGATVGDIKAAIAAARGKP